MEQLLTKQVVAALLGLAPNTVGDKRWQAQVGLRPIRLGTRTLRYRRSDLAQLMATATDKKEHAPHDSR